MGRKNNSKMITADILQQAVKGAFLKLDPRYMVKNPL